MSFSFFGGGWWIWGGSRGRRFWFFGLETYEKIISVGFFLVVVGIRLVFGARWS